VVLLNARKPEGNGRRGKGAVKAAWNCATGFFFKFVELPSSFGARRKLNALTNPLR